MCFRPILAACLSLTAAVAHAQTTQDEQLWINLSAFGNNGKGLVWFVEGQPRVGNGMADLQQYLIRGAAGVQLTRKLTLWQGYAHVEQTLASGRARNEERSFQQLWWTLKPGFWVRTRLEERWLSDGGDVGFRLRSMVRYGHKLGSSKRSIAALVSVEPYVALNSTDWGARAGFDQVRSFAGIEVPTIGKSTIELGYLNQFINDPGGRHRSNHVLAVNIFFRQ